MPTTSTSRTARASLTGSLAGLLILLATAAQALASYTVRPGQFNPADPATRAYFKPVLRPGASLTQTLVITNTGSSTVRLYVYAVDGLTGQTTGTVYANRHDPVRKAGRWVRPAVSQITVARGSTATVPFTIRVPRNATPGDHVAGIALEDTQHATGGSAFRITEIFREVTGIQIQVPGRAFPRPTVGPAHLKALPGTPVASVVVPLGNSGLRLCKPTLSVALRGPNDYHRTVVRPLDTVLPGDRVPYPLPWPGRLARGKYLATAIATCPGARAKAASTALLGKALGTSGASAGANAKRAGSGVPGWLLILVALLGAGAGVGLTYLRMARRHRAALAAAATRG
jgi:hypothetical protein